MWQFVGDVEDAESMRSPAKSTERRPRDRVQAAGRRRCCRSELGEVETCQSGQQSVNGMRVGHRGHGESVSGSRVGRHGSNTDNVERNVADSDRGDKMIDGRRRGETDRIRVARSTQR